MLVGQGAGRSDHRDAGRRRNRGASVEDRRRPATRRSWTRRGRRSPQSQILKPGDTVPDTTLVDENTARPLTSLKGHRVALTFMYALPAARLLPADGSQFRRRFRTRSRRHPASATCASCRSASIRPTTPPAVLKTHAKALQADPAVWHFVTASTGDIKGFAAKFGVIAGTERRESARPHSQPEHRGHRCRRHARENSPGQHVDAGRPHCRSQSGSRSRALTRRRRHGSPARAAERRIIDRLRSPLAVQRWLNALPYATRKGRNAPQLPRGRRARHRALPRGGALGGRHPRAASLPPLVPELRVDRPARPCHLRVPRSARLGIGGAIARPWTARQEARVRHAARARPQLLRPVSTSPGA